MLFRQNIFAFLLYSKKKYFSSRLAYIFWIIHSSFIIGATESIKLLFWKKKLWAVQYLKKKCEFISVIKYLQYFFGVQNHFHTFILLLKNINLSHLIYSGETGYFLGHFLTEANSKGFRLLGWPNLSFFSILIWYPVSKLSKCSKYCQEWVAIVSVPFKTVHMSNNRLLQESGNFFEFVSCAGS